MLETIIRIFGFISWVVAFSITIKVMLGYRNPIKTLAWILVLNFLPVLGLILYFFFGADIRHKRYINRRFMSQIEQRAYKWKLSDEREFPEEYMPLKHYLDKVGNSYLSYGNSVEVITVPEKFIHALLREIYAAKEHIHFQFYIFNDDAVGRMVRDALIDKLREGVEVRVIYDSVGCWKTDKEFFEKLRHEGAYVEAFSKVRFPIFSTGTNYRNHRKVVVIDGKVGFLGGYNIANRYIKGVSWGVWRDTMLLLRGGAVHGLQASFLMDWHFANRSVISGARYFPVLQTSPGDVTMHVSISNPVGEWRTIPDILTMMLSAAKKYVYLQTPYLMPSEQVSMAMRRAVLSGVDVRLMIPRRCDSAVATAASSAYLGELLRAGVKIYFYEKGFLHSKAAVCDDLFSTVGSANLDFRSFDYNFEIMGYMYNKSVARRLRDTFMEDSKECKLLTLSEYNNRPLCRKLFEAVARLASPLL